MADDTGHAQTAGQPQAAPFKAKNLIVLSDGTGNSSAKLFRTNVWRIYEALDLNCPDQVALYDNGVGTASFKPIAILGGAFGYGLKRNVLDLYTFLCRNYKAADGYEYDPDKPVEEEKELKKHDHIFAFGFSRGAFTARVVASLVANEGLIPHTETDAELKRLAKWAYRSYRRKRYRHQWGVKFLRWMRDRLLRLVEWRKPVYGKQKNIDVPVDFLGVFDTVAAYGLPIDELTRGWNRWVWPMLPEGSSLNARVKYARHALAIDDERQTFFPLLWDEDSTDEKENKKKFSHPDDRIKQVWFAGMHSNVGGGYADDALSLVPLRWMATEATAKGLRLQQHMRLMGSNVPDAWVDRAAPCAPMGDSRHGVAAYYRYHPRPLGRLCGFKDHSSEHNPDARVKIDRPKIHESVFERIKDARDNYAPFGLPANYAVVKTDGTVLDESPFEHPTQAASRVHEQQVAWDAVWMRRVTYFLTIGATVFLLALPLIPVPKLPGLDASNTLQTAIGAVGGFLPGFAQSWLVAYNDRPGWLVLAALSVAGLLRLGSRLKGEVNDRMGKVWASRSRNGLQANELGKIADKPTGWIYNVRESAGYKRTFRFMSDTLWPNVFGIAMLLIILAGIPLRLVYQVVSRTDSFCSASGVARDVQIGIPDATSASASVRYVNAKEVEFYPNEICRWITGSEVGAGKKYAIQIAIPLGPAPPNAAEAESQTTEDRDKCRADVPDPNDKQRVGGWKDLTIPVTSTAGIGSNSVMALFLPFRRIWAAKWFVPIAAIGTKIPERHYLSTPTTEFTATREGPLSFYVNDAAFPIGWIKGELCLGWDCYYRNNSGGPARVRVTELDANTAAASLPPLAPFTCDEQRQMLPPR